MNVTNTPTHPTLITIFGGTGDLAETKLIPALFHLFVAGKLPTTFHIIGLSRKELGDNEYREFVTTCLLKRGITPSDMLTEFCTHIRYLRGDIESSDAYQRLATTLRELDGALGQCTSKLFYLAVPPPLYEPIFTHIYESKLMSLCDGESSWSRLLVEKPFGRDLDTARALEEQLTRQFREEQVYRIDHYLAKDAIENIMALRFANSIISDSWNKERIESIAIRLFEARDVATRGAFYDAIGALRDVGQNHMLQMFALLTMDRAETDDASSVRAHRALALRALAGETPHTLVRGQYAGYRDTQGVAPDSHTETYFRIETALSHDMWKGVELILESGKGLDRSVTEATITFRAGDTCLCGTGDDAHTHQNVLTITFSPKERIALTIWVKRPGFGYELEKKEFILAESEGLDEHSPEAYERVLYDCIVGDQRRFVSGDEVVAAWEFMTPIMRGMQEVPLMTYTTGSCDVCRIM